MPILSDLDLATLIIEKLNHSGVSFLKGIGCMTEAAAVDKLGTLQYEHRHFFNKINRDYIFDNLNDIVYQLSLENDPVLAIGLYKELQHTSLEEAHAHQKTLMSMPGKRAIDENNIWQKMKNDATGKESTDLHTAAASMPIDSELRPAKRYVFAYIILVAAVGFFYYLWDEANYRHDMSKASRYFLFLTFSIMALVFLFLYSTYQRWVIRRIKRGETINRG